MDMLFDLVDLVVFIETITNDVECEELHDLYGTP